jgi:hypothetical protein
MHAPKSLSLDHVNITDEGVLALISLPALTHLDIRGCTEVTAAGWLTGTPKQHHRP